MMNPLFAKRMEQAHRSFIREILKVTQDPEIISFAGGLPNPKCFPVTGVAAAAARVFAESGPNAMQYSTTEGFLPLREWIAARYRKCFEMTVDPEEILITNGSQQGLDLIAKVFLDEGDRVVLEKPAYLGAIQAFSVFEPEFRTVNLEDDGADLDQLQQCLTVDHPKLFYTVANFQNPSGITYSPEKRAGVARLLQNCPTVLVEDDPYGELRFLGEGTKPIRSYCKQRAILLGSFSKIVAPGLRMGWIYAPRAIMEKLITVKQGADLHSNYLTQRIIYQHLKDNDLDQHISFIRATYKKQRDLMVQMLEEYCPSEVQFTRPEGGMFLWLTLPEGVSALELLDETIEEKVAFVPGNAFYTDGSGGNTLRLNFSNSDEVKIEKGIKLLGKAIARFLEKVNAGGLENNPGR
jgi:2-aminoadipate transaminase